MRVRVATPNEFAGDVLGDLNTRRAHVTEMESSSDACSVVILAYVPRPDLHTYMDALRAMTQGRATAEMEFSHFRDVDFGENPDSGAGIPALPKPAPPTLSAGAAAEPPPDAPG